MEKEIWKAVDGYEGLYEVSNFGRIRSLDRMIIHSDGRKRLFKGRILKPKKYQNGYLFCDLYKNGQMKNVLIHRLVAEAFIQNPDNLPVINHKDEVKTNNRVENLEWCTQSYNINYGTAIQRREEKRLKPVLQIDINTGRVISEYPSLMEAARKLNIHSSAISMCCNGKRKTAYVYKWKYK